MTDGINVEITRCMITVKTPEKELKGHWSVEEGISFESIRYKDIWYRYDSDLFDKDDIKKFTDALQEYFDKWKKQAGIK